MKGLKSKIITTILDETGIRLHPKDIHISTGDHLLVLKLWSTEMIRKKYQSEKSLESDEFAEDLLTELFDEYYDMREKVIEVKKEELNGELLHNIREKILKDLNSKNIDSVLLNNLDFEFTESSSFRNNILSNDWGYPTMGLRITDYETIDFFYPIDLYKDPLILDEKLILNELLKKL